MKIQFLLLIIILTTAATITMMSQATAFTYQGRLSTGSTPANGSYDFEFRIFNALTDGSQMGSTMTIPGVVVTDGVFTVGLNFGDVFDGSTRFLEVSVRPAGSGDYTTLAPRQIITSTPYAVRSATAGNALELGGVAANQYVLTTDPRMTNARTPTSGSADYVQNTTIAQAASFNVTGNGTVAGTISGNQVSAVSQYDLGGVRILANTGTANLFAGAGAGVAITSGADNAFFGAGAGAATTTGLQNTFVGSDAGVLNTSGQQNAFFGFEAGAANTTSTRNAFFGSGAGRVTTGGSNSFFGGSAGVNTTTGASNVFVGTAAGNGNTTGEENVFVGAFTGHDSVSTASESVIVGFSAGRTNRGASNTFVGKDSGRANTTGTSNVFLGRQAGLDNTTGFSNAFVGAQSGSSAINGSLNAFLGWNSGLATTSGSSNTFVGASAGDSNLTGGSNTLLGASTDVEAGNLTFATAIGAGATVASSSTIVLGRTAGQDAVHVWGVLRVGLEGAGALDVCRNANFRLSTCSSSLRYKNDVQTYGGGLELLTRLRPISFNWKSNGERDLGFAAEEVASVEPLLATYNDKGEIEGVKYKQLTAVLVNAANEQQKTIQEQGIKIDQQQKRLDVQQRQIETLRRLVCALNTAADVCQGVGSSSEEN